MKVSTMRSTNRPEFQIASIAAVQASAAALAMTSPSASNGLGMSPRPGMPAAEEVADVRETGNAGHPGCRAAPGRPPSVADRVEQAAAGQTVREQVARAAAGRPQGRRRRP